MRVLWLSITPSNYQSEFVVSAYKGGGWISSMEELISQSEGIELAVSFVMSGQPFKIKQDHTTYYPIPNPIRQSLAKRIQKFVRYAFGLGIQEYETKVENYYKDYFKKIIDDFSPDLIHVWGSESYMGLVAEVTQVPITLHIQGLINPYLNAFFPPSISWGQWLWGVKNPYEILLKKMGKRLWEVNSDREKRILKRCKFLMGRTQWDYRISKIYSPLAQYLHAGEVLRDVFYKESDRILPEKLTIVSTISSPLYKGYDMILKTAQLLKKELGMNFEWRCYGNISPNFIEKRIGIVHSDVCVQLEGVASAEELFRSLKQATVYFHSSYIDNSPNAVCEAQLIGVPVVATNVGGVSSIVADGVEGYLVPSNDPFQAAYCIYDLYSDQNKNLAWGANGQASAKKRHNRDVIVRELLENYRTILSQRY